MTDTVVSYPDTGHATHRKRLTLRKSAKLRHRTLVQGVFDKGKSVYSGPLRFTFRTLNEQELANSFKVAIPDKIGPLQVMITVPKKKRRHAVDRVLMRRRIREAFRLQCGKLWTLVKDDPTIRTLSIAIVYTQSVNTPMSDISPAVDSAIAKITKKVWQQPSPNNN